MKLRRFVLFACVAGAILIPATTASAAQRSAPGKLSLVPLQASELGPANASLPLAYGSGSLDGSFGVFIGGGSGSFDLSPTGGYALDYGDPYTGSTGVMEIRSSVEEYRAPKDARLAFRFMRLDQLFFGELFVPPVVHTTDKKVKPLPVGEQRVGSLTTESVPNLNPIVKLDEQVLAGRFILDLTVTAGSASAAEHIAPHLLLLLHHHLFLLLTRHQNGTPAKLPPEPQAGQAPGGPDLSTLILQPSDIGQPHAVNLFQEYIAGPPTLSDFFMLLSPAGSYLTLLQQIAWWPSATEATYGETYGGGFPAGFFLSPGLGGTVTPVDVSAAGDSALGYIVSGDGQSAAYVTLTNGQAGETVFAQRKSFLQPSDVLSLAEAAANRLDAGLGP